MKGKIRDTSTSTGGIIMDQVKQQREHDEQTRTEDQETRRQYEISMVIEIEIERNENYELTFEVAIPDEKLEYLQAHICNMELGG